MYSIPLIHHRTMLVDLFLAVGLATLSVTVALAATGGGSTGDAVRPDHVLEWALLLIPPAAVAGRRRAPVVAMAIGNAATMVIWASGMPDVTLASGVLIYSAAVYGSEPTGTRAAIAGSVILTAFTILGATTGEAEAFVVPIVALTTFGAAMLGINVATRAAYTAEVEERAALAGRHRAVSEQAMLQSERSRMARELHDVVAHGLGVIVVQAAAGRRIIDSDVDGAREVLARIENVGRSSLAEMRHLVDVLRTETNDQDSQNGQLRPTPGIASIDELIEGFRTSDVTVEFEERGERPELPITIDTAVYRIVQEALTNVLKHSGPGAAAVATITHGADRVDVRVVDNGRGGAAPRGGGHGLVGMRERVDVFGGTLRVGPRPGGGFEVLASLPFELATT